jgi:cytochrome c553
MNKLAAIVLAMALWPLTAMAEKPAAQEIAEDLKAALQAKGDPERGAAVFRQCQNCHGEDASGRTNGAYPRLSGQHATVLMKQITDILAGRRINRRMRPYFENHALKPGEIADLAGYLQGLPIPANNGKGFGAGGSTAGKALYERDCVSCHGAKGEGSAEKFYPMVAAQHYRYLLRQLQYIRDGDRRNSNPDMVAALKSSYTIADLEAVAEYMAQLPPPTK